MASRRQFLATAGALTALPAIVTSATPRRAPSDTLVLGLIGCRGMGFGDLSNHLNQAGVVCGALCDVDDAILQQRGAEIEARTGTKPALHRDFRALLDNPDIDAVIIGTPDHWHALMMVLACQAGKDVYVEKPMANSVAELDLMVRAARRYNRVVQVGQQQRSGPHWKEVVDFVQSGQLGAIRQVRVWGHYDYGKGLERIPNGTAPAGLDYDLYLGPAADQPYNANRLHNGWRHQWSFGGGLLTDWGVHLLDIVLWAMHVDGPPKSVAGAGGIYAYPERAIETPDTLSVLYEMDGYTLSWEHFGGIEGGLFGRNYGIAFIGNNGTLIVNRESWEVVPEIGQGAYLMTPFPTRPGSPNNHGLHAADFIEAIKTRQDPACTVEMGQAAAFYAHLGNIAYRTGSRLVWDAAQNRFAGNPIADDYLKPAYRKPWSWPEVG